MTRLRWPLAALAVAAAAVLGIGAVVAQPTAVPVITGVSGR